MSPADTFLSVSHYANNERRLLLNHVRNFSRSRLSLLLALLATFAVTLACLPNPAMATCADAVYESFYSDSTFTTMVGECHHDCCHLYTCTGQVTQYGRVDERFRCDFQ
jgi:hypothetical protein